MMKKCVVAVGILCAAAFRATPVSAAFLFEPFNYSTGALAGNTNATAPASTNGASNTNVWTVGGTTTTNPNVVNANLSYPNLPASTGNAAQLTGNGGTSLGLDRIAIGDTVEGSTIYFSMLVQVPSSPTPTFNANTTTGSFFTGFQWNPSTISTTETMSSGTASSASPLTVRTDPGGGGYNLGIAFRDTATRQFNTTKLLPGDTVMVVGKYEINTGDFNDKATLYLNPDLSSTNEPSVASAISANATGGTVHDYFFGSTGTQLESNIRSMILRNNGLEPSNMLIDEVRIGSSYADVIGVPEPAGLSLLGLGALGLLRRRRQAA